MADKSRSAARTPLVRVSVRAAFTDGGRVWRPRVDGDKCIPVEAVIPRELALRVGKARAEILGDAPDGAVLSGFTPDAGPTA